MAPILHSKMIPLILSDEEQNKQNQTFIHNILSSYLSTISCQNIFWRLQKCKMYSLWITRRLNYYSITFYNDK